MYGQQNPYSQYPYTGYTYPNYGNRQFMQPQPQQQQQIQPQAVVPTLCYAKMEEAKPYIITATNSSILFIDREAGKALLKTTDNMCNSYSRYFVFNESDENGNALQAKKEEVAPQIDYEKFITKDDLSKYGFVTKDQFNALFDKLKLVENQITKGAKENVGTAKSAKEN